MYEVIIERPRGGGGWARAGGRARMRDRVEPELAPQREPIAPRSRRSKWLNENLAPLRRFLLRRVGRPWSEVHAEICATLRVTSAVQKHVLDHLRDMVYTSVVQEGDRLLEHGSRGVEPLRGSRWSPVYVCPRTGLLKQVPAPPRLKPPRPRDVVPIDADAQFRRIDGQWYRVTLSPLPDAWGGVRDLLLGELDAYRSLWQLGPILRQHYGRDDRYATGKRELGKRELRRVMKEVRG